jgi:hypothetical protein
MRRTLFYRDDVGNVIVMDEVNAVPLLGIVIPGGHETTPREDAKLLHEDELPVGYDPLLPSQCREYAWSHEFMAALTEDGRMELPTESITEDDYLENA